MSPEYGFFIKVKVENPENARRLHDQIKKLTGVEEVEFLAGFQGTIVKDTYLTRKEAATYLRVHTRTIARYVKLGFLKEYRIGATGHSRYKTDDLDMLEHPSKPH